MAPITHLLASWVIAAKATDNPRDCRLVALAGILPDADGLGLIVDMAHDWAGGRATQYYARYHHYLLHGVAGALLIALILTCFAKVHWRVFLLCLIVIHLHIFCDFLASRGPAPEDLWGIYYFGPFDRDPMWIWKGQWRLDGWQNRIITVALFFWALKLPLDLGHSVVGVFNRKADSVFVSVLRKWRSNWQQMRRQQS